MKYRLLRLLHRIAQTPVLGQAVNRACMVFHRAYENCSYDPQANGEYWVIRQLARQHQLNLCLDVGANHGEWTALATQANPQAEIHSFEISPATYQQLQKNLGAHTNVTLNPCGLANRAASVDIFHDPEADGLTTMIAGLRPGHHRKVAAEVMRGDVYCEAKQIKQIDLLKIDVEGAEMLVLEGFGDLLNPEQIRVIQFEYGYTNIKTKHLLWDYHRFFESRGYLVGKLFPRHVRIRPYQTPDENFLGPNMIAVAPAWAPLLDPAYPRTSSTSVA